MILNGRYFVPPDDGEDDFKTLFRLLAASGAGRPVDAGGLPEGPWTPDLLAEAITRIDANRKGIEPRTVQLWFQDNQKGVSAENIRWLARIFGCSDPEATSAWQRELTASQSRLTAKRRAGRRKALEDVQPQPAPSGTDGHEVDEDGVGGPPTRAAAPPVSRRVRGLAGWSERLYGLGGPLNLPASIFAGATALQFASYFIGNHSITYVRQDGVEKQVGFHWATNWSFLFMLFLPLFVIFASHLVSFWRTHGRAALLPDADRASAVEAWLRNVARSNPTFWAVLLICLGFAGGVQWIGARLLPLSAGMEDGPIDWASVALVRPDVVTVPEAVVFSGLAYFYMAVCFYVMFAGLILLYILADDYWDVAKGQDATAPVREDIARVILKGLYRCTAAGLLVAICMTVQNRYLPSDALDVWAWLFGDMLAVRWGSNPIPSDGYGFVMHYTSLLVALPTCAVMIYGIVRVAIPAGVADLSLRMAAALALIAAGYLLTGAFRGFSLLLGLAVLLCLYGLFDPTYGSNGGRAKSEGRRV
ncbi:RcgA family putative transporter [Jannaschia rubra]|uniref:RcgA family putative transporter n=1 Tax=Jannaschia rubra TaxID=282197 RepID=UPI0011873F97|nr:hypothetical protein [Jannaschia rubra]